MVSNGADFRVEEVALFIVVSLIMKSRSDDLARLYFLLSYRKI